MMNWSGAGGWLLGSGLCLALCGCEVSDSDGSSGDAGKPDSSTQYDAGDTGPRGFRFLRIDDNSSSEGGAHPAPDIAAISMTTAGGSPEFATTVRDNASGVVNIDGITSEPKKPVDCVVGEFASLGGTGGYVILNVAGADLDSGDTITVYEVGETECAPSGAEKTDITVSLSDHRDPAGNWTSVGQCGSGVCSLTVP